AEDGAGGLERILPGAARARSEAVERDVVRLDEVEGAVGRGRNAGECRELAREVRLIGVAGCESGVGEGEVARAGKAIGDALKTNDAREDLGREADCATEELDED